jgi:hypothetical protein
MRKTGSGVRNIVSRRAFIIGVGSVAVIGAAALILPKLPKTTTTENIPSSTTSISTSGSTPPTTKTTSTQNQSATGSTQSTQSTYSTTTKSSTSNTTSALQSLAGILIANGLSSRTVLAYGEPLENSIGTFSSLTAALQYYISQNFKIYPIQDGSNGYSTSYWPTVVSVMKAANGIVLGPTYGYDYNIAFFDPATGNLDTVSLWPWEQAFSLRIHRSRVGCSRTHNCFPETLRTDFCRRWKECTCWNSWLGELRSRDLLRSWRR